MEGYFLGWNKSPEGLYLAEGGPGNERRRKGLWDDGFVVLLLVVVQGSGDGRRLVEGIIVPRWVANSKKCGAHLTSCALCASIHPRTHNPDQIK